MLYICEKRMPRSAKRFEIRSCDFTAVASKVGVAHVVGEYEDDVGAV